MHTIDATYSGSGRGEVKKTSDFANDHLDAPVRRVDNDGNVRAPAKILGTLNSALKIGLSQRRF